MYRPMSRLARYLMAQSTVQNSLGSVLNRLTVRFNHMSLFTEITRPELIGLSMLAVKVRITVPDPIIPKPPIRFNILTNGF